MEDDIIGKMAYLKQGYFAGLIGIVEESDVESIILVEEGLLTEIPELQGGI